jgi:hypothetical protein
MIDNDQSTIIEAPEVYKSIPTHSPTAKPTTEWDKNVDFDTFDGHVLVNYIEPNLQKITFRPIRVGLITQKQFWDQLKNIPRAGAGPLTKSNDNLLLHTPTLRTETPRPSISGWGYILIAASHIRSF